MILKTIKINFTDFWGGFDKTDNYFYNLLKQNFNIVSTAIRLKSRYKNF